MSDKIECFECDGHYDKVLQDYHTRIDENLLTVPDIEILVCPNCGDECIDWDNSTKIDKFIEAYRMNL